MYKYKIMSSIKCLSWFMINGCVLAVLFYKDFSWAVIYLYVYMYIYFYDFISNNKYSTKSQFLVRNVNTVNIILGI